MRKLWTPEEIAWLKANYAHLPTFELCKHLGRSKESIYGASYVYGLKKSASYLATPFSGRIMPGKKLGGNVFKKGQIPFNKGKKMIEYLSADALQKIRKTAFKKGNLPHNTLYDGALRTRQDKSGLTYLYIRIAKAKWELLQRHVWQQHYGQIPAGKLIAFKDGNSLNCAIENLMLIDRKQNMLRNTIHRYPAEVKEAIRVVSKLKRKIKTYEKQD